jgi:lysyl-tRNA synthetase class 2
MEIRARMLQDMRAFFAERYVLEVETPVLSRAATSDPHLHSLTTGFAGRELFLHTSPEFFMKRLLAAHDRDIYQICKVFRDDERGMHHNPEFSLLEWYRRGFDHRRLMEEIQQLLNRLTVSLRYAEAPLPVVRLSYRQAFLDALGLDPLTASCWQLKQATLDCSIGIPVGMDEQDKDMWLDWLLTQVVAPGFSRQGFTFLYDFPASQAALARLSEQDARVAHRFEVFYGELELGNGFYELADVQQQRRRFLRENECRRRLGMAEMPLDEHLLAALEAGLPDCSGVAIGIDRLLMVFTGAHAIDNVMSFGFDRI